MRTGIPDCCFVAGHKDLNLARGVPIPEFRHSLVKLLKLAEFQSITKPIPPRIAIIGVALEINLAADQAIYAEIIPQDPKRVRVLLSVLEPLHKNTKAQPNAISDTIGP